VKAPPCRENLQLDSGIRHGIAQQEIARGQCQLIHRAGGPNTEFQTAAAALVLYRGQRACRDQLDHFSIPCT
jgi:hypothetical protein